MRRGMPPGAVELSYLEKKVLLALAKLEKSAPEEIRDAGKFRELVEVMNAASWLQAKGLVTMRERVIHSYRLAKPEVARRELPERKALKAAIKAGGRIEATRLKSACKFDDAELAVALGWLRRKGWADVSKGPEGSFVIVTSAGRAAANSKGPDEILLARLAKGELTEDATNLPQHGLHGDRGRLCAPRVLELRCALPAARSSRAGPARYVLSGEAVDEASPGRRDRTPGRGGSRDRRNHREHRVAVPMEPHGGRTRRPPLAHDADHLEMAGRAPRSAAEGARRERHLPPGGDGAARAEGARAGVGPRPRATDHGGRRDLGYPPAVPERHRLVARPPRRPLSAPHPE